MPPASAMACCSGWVMKPCTSSLSAPGKVVVTVTTVFSVDGYWRTSSRSSERTPASRISRLITVASTGRWMKMSVNFIDRSPRPDSA
jgi:hypothetical protein